MARLQMLNCWWMAHIQHVIFNWGINHVWKDLSFFFWSMWIMKPLIQYIVLYKLSEMNSFLKTEKDNTIKAAECCTWQDDILGLSDYLNEYICFFVDLCQWDGPFFKKLFPMKRSFLVSFLLCWKQLTCFMQLWLDRKLFMKGGGKKD